MKTTEGVFSGSEESVTPWTHSVLVLVYDTPSVRDTALRFLSAEGAESSPNQLLTQAWSFQEIVDDSAGKLAALDAMGADRLVIACCRPDHWSPELEDWFEEWLTESATKKPALRVLGAGLGLASHVEEWLLAKARAAGVTCVVDPPEAGAVSQPESGLPVPLTPLPTPGGRIDWGINE